MIQWLGLCASTAEGVGSIPGQGSSACLEVWQKKKKIKELEVICAKHLRQELIQVGTQKMAGISISDPALRL